MEGSESRNGSELGAGFEPAGSREDAAGAGGGAGLPPGAVRCGGCGRVANESEPAGGTRFLCARCLHLLKVGPEPARASSPTSLKAVAAAALGLTALAGGALCALYLLGTGNLLWFGLLAAATFVLVAFPSAVLLRYRNLTLLVASLFIPMGFWAHIWFRAPGVDWEYAESTGWGSLFFLAIGLITLLLFLRDLRSLPRL